MGESLPLVIQQTCRTHRGDPGRLMDIVRDVQAKLGVVDPEAIDLLARELKIPRVEIESLVSFYAFYSQQPKGKIVIRLCDDVIDRMRGGDRVAAAFRDELGIGFGETTADGAITLEHTPCIGMCDQAPAALVNDVVVTELSTDTAREIVKALRKHGDPSKLVQRLGDGANAHDLVHSMVKNTIQKTDAVIFADLEPGKALRKALAMSPAEVIRDVKTARLRGRGGAGFPTGMKWEFTRNNPADQRYLVCNADEGEPGTFKDRVILTEAPELLFEGMTIAGYAIGASEGILYLRAEYAYLQRYLEHVLAERRKQNLLGQNVLGKQGFSYDIRIQMGAGAYVCGEETALLSSCEGKRGDPKNRPPFPAQKGYLDKPTSVNNVETLCCVARILDQGPGWFAQFGTKGSTGTKLLSISGDCKRPGVYELPFGISVSDLLKMVGAEDAIAVQVGGASGQMIGPDQYGRVICFDDLATGGSIMVFGPERNVIDVARQFVEFFGEESCGYCTPCRVGNVLLKQKLEQILGGHGEPADIPYLLDLGETMKATSRCGLGQTASNPVVTTIKNFRSAYNALLKERPDGMQASFDLQSSLHASEEITGRKSIYFHE